MAEIYMGISTLVSFSKSLNHYEFLYMLAYILAENGNANYMLEVKSILRCHTFQTLQTVLIK